MKTEKPILHYWSPLPPAKGGFYYRQQHMEALSKYFKVKPIDMTGIIQPLLMFITAVLVAPIGIMARLTRRHKFVEYVEYDFATYKSPFFFPVVTLLKFIYGCRFIFRLHEDYGNLSYGWLLRFYDNFWLSICADIIMVHTFTHAELLWRINQRKGTVMLSGLKIVNRKSKPQPNTIIVPGFINRWKGHDILLDALLEVKKEIPDVRLIIAGKIHDKEFYEELNRNMNYYDLRKNIELHTGYLNKRQMGYLLSKASLAVLPYRRINFSAALLDCIDWEIPTIVSNIPHFRELCPELPKFGDSAIPNLHLFECDGNHAVIDNEYDDSCWCYKPSKQLARKIIEILGSKREMAKLREKMRVLKHRYDIDAISKEESKIILAEMENRQHERRH